MFRTQRCGAVATALTLVGLTAAVFVAGPASADPKPAPCAGLLYTDPAGDTNDDPSGNGAPTGPVGDQADITGVFLNHAPGAGGKSVLTANLQINNLTETIPSDAGGGLYYYFTYTLADDVQHYVDARHTSSGWSYYFGHIEIIGFIGAYTNDGQTTGSQVLGKDGVVSVVVPDAVGGTLGTTLKATGASVDILYAGDDASGWQSHADSAPDKSSDAKDVVVTACPAGSTPAPGGGGTTPTPTPTPTSTPTPSGSGGGGSAPPSSGGGGTPPSSGGNAGNAPATKPLPFKVTKVLGTSKKGLKLKVKAGQAISDLLVQIRKAGGKGPVVATIKAPSLKKGTSTLKLKKSKKIKKGSYSVLATGSVDGKPLSTTQSFKVKK